MTDPAFISDTCVNGAAVLIDAAVVVKEFFTKELKALARMALIRLFSDRITTQVTREAAGRWGSVDGRGQRRVNRRVAG